MVGIAEGNCDDPEYAKGWRLFDKLIWIASKSNPAIGYVGRCTYVYGDVHKWLDAMKKDPELDDMHKLQWTAFRQLLAGTYYSGKNKSNSYTKAYKWGVADAPQNAESILPKKTSGPFAPLIRQEAAALAQEVQKRFSDDAAQRAAADAAHAAASSQPSALAPRRTHTDTRTRHLWLDLWISRGSRVSCRHDRGMEACR